MPVAFSTERREGCLAFARPQGDQVTDPGTHPAPLFPVAHADAPPDPLIDSGNGPGVVRPAEADSILRVLDDSGAAFGAFHAIGPCPWRAHTMIL